MGLDIRMPLGLVFLCTGLILLVYGLITYGSGIYAISGGLNLNLGWGAVMTLFGAGMFLSARRAGR